MKTFRMIWIGTLGLLPGTLLAEDVVEYFGPDDKRLVARGTIKEETPRELAIQTSKGPVRIEVYRLDEVKYDGQPPTLTTTAAIERQGRYDQALAEYREVLSGLPESAEFLEAAVAFAVLRCSALKGIGDPAQSDEAVKLHAASAEKFRESRHYYPMRELMGRLFLARGDLDKAAQEFAALKDVDWPGYRQKGITYEGLAHLRKGELDQARLAFDDVLASPATDRLSQEQKYLASVFKADVLVQQGKAPEARSLVAEAITQIPAEETYLQAIAHNTLGDALVSAGEPKQAMLDGYLWVVTVYRKHPDQVAKALYQLAQIFPKVGHAPKAEEAIYRLKNEFPNSPWTRKLSEPATPAS